MKTKTKTYLIYDKKTGEVYHQNLFNFQAKKQKLRGKLLGLNVKIKKEN
jgi:hypothetical protein